MSHLVSYKWIRKTQVIPEYVGFYKNVGILLGGSDCEELMGVTHRRMMGLDYCFVHCFIPEELYLTRKMSLQDTRKLHLIPPEFAFPSNPPSVQPVI